MSASDATPDIDVARWATCEREALHGPDRSRIGGAVHVGAIVAQRVWSTLSGEDCQTIELPLGGITLDYLTPREEDIARTAGMMVVEADRALDG